MWATAADKRLNTPNTLDARFFISWGYRKRATRDKTQQLTWKNILQKYKSWIFYFPFFFARTICKAKTVNPCSGFSLEFVPRMKRTAQDATFFFPKTNIVADIVHEQADTVNPSNTQLYLEPTILPRDIFFGEKIHWNPSSSHFITAGTAVQVWQTSTVRDMLQNPMQYTKHAQRTAMQKNKQRSQGQKLRRVAVDF